ncbi:hypothetical protein ACROYT_G034918 [Oculina patagonica]
MEKGTRASKISSPIYVHDATSSRFLDSFQGYVYPTVPLVDKRALHFSSLAKRKDFAGEIAPSENAAQAVSNKDNRENNFKTTLAKHLAKKRDESKEKARKKRKKEDGEANNGTRERESYRERRRKNNASAKKSRDARKAREMETQRKAAFLERENLRILAQLMIVQQENAFHINLEIKEINMEKGTRASKIGSPIYVHDATSSRYFDSFYGHVYPAIANVSLVDKRAIHFSSLAAKRKDFAGEIAPSENAAQAVSNKDNRENNFKTTLAKHLAKKREESKEKGGKKEEKRRIFFRRR